MIVGGASAEDVRSDDEGSDDEGESTKTGSARPDKVQNGHRANGYYDDDGGGGGGGTANGKANGHDSRDDTANSLESRKTR